MVNINFSNVNSLNKRINWISGNLLPITADSRHPLGWRVYSVVVWIIEIAHTYGLLLGFVRTPKDKAIKDATVAIVITLEISFLFYRLHTRNKLVEQIIEITNNLLSHSDDTMNDIIKATFKPIALPLTIHGVIGITTVSLWTVRPAYMIIGENRTDFYFVDYNLPTSFTKEPFSGEVLVSSCVLMMFGSTLLFLKKFSIDIFMMHLSLLTTALYRYIAVKLAMLFEDKQDKRDKSFQVKTDSETELTMRTLCWYHTNVLRISFLLKKVLALNFSFIYLNSVCRFSFIGILMSTIISIPLTDVISILLFAFGSVLQFFTLCFSVQALSDASIEITDKAFDEGWYQFKPSIRRDFMLLIMANALECKIAVVETFNLSLSSFMTIMNQSYSIALLFLKMK